MALLLSWAARFRCPLGSTKTAAWCRLKIAMLGGTPPAPPASDERRCMAMPLLKRDGCCSAFRTARIICSGVMPCACIKHMLSYRTPHSTQLLDYTASHSTEIPSNCGKLPTAPTLRGMMLQLKNKLDASRK